MRSVGPQRPTPKTSGLPLSTSATGGRRYALAGLALMLAGMVAAGCTHLNNPWKDSGAATESEMTTPSADAYQGHAEFGRQTRRDSAPSAVGYENGSVTHWPLWFEDPFEDKGNGYQPVADRDAPDDEFAMNWVDYLHIAYGPGRMFFVNTAGWPVSAVVTPPGTLMESDGRIDKNILSYDHDAKRSNAATREPPDVNIINKTPPEPTGLSTEEVPPAPSPGQ